MAKMKDTIGIRLRKFLSAVILMLFAAIWVSCVSTSGAQFPDENIYKVDIGMTADDITELLGEPYVVEKYSGGERWIWVYATKRVVYGFVAIMQGGTVSSISEYRDAN